MIIEVNGQQVEVDDSFASLPSEQQQAELAHITQVITPKASVEVRGASPEDLINSLTPTITGAIVGEIAGPVVNKMTEGYQKSRAARIGTPAPTTAGNMPARGLVPTPDQHTRIIQGGVDETGTTGRARQQGYNERTAVQSLERQAAEKNMQDLARRRIITGESPLTKIAAPTSTPSGIIVPGSAVYEAPTAAPAAKAPTIVSKIGAHIPGPVQDVGRALGAATQSGVAPWLGRGLAGAGVGFQGADAYNRFQKGDYPGAAISGIGALGSAASFIPHPATRVGGASIGIGAEALNAYLDRLKEKAEQQPVQAPLSAPMPQMAKGGDVLKAVKDVAKKFNYDPYKIANQYPDVIPPVLAIDPKTGKEYFKKQLSPEALEVQKARKAAQKEIDAGNYTPFFDESKRFYADPSHYPTAGYTATDAVPKKADTIAKYEALANDPEALARLRAAYQSGSDKPDAKDWYAMGQLEDAFIRELGPEEGRRQFKARFADAMAATTGGADPNSNLMMAAFTNYQKQLGREIPTAASELPFPIGGRYVSGNMEQARKLADVGEISAVTNPKRHNFSANFLGHRDVSTLDEQMSQLWDPKMMAPPTNAYGIYQQALAKEAEKAGVLPANFQDVAWAGAKDYQGKPMIREINEMLARTHAITGEPQEEILKGYIRANKPMYGIGAIGGLGALDEEKQ